MSPPPPLMPSPGDLISLLASGGWDSFGPAVILAAHFSSLPSATTGGDDDDTAAWSSATMAGVGAAVVAAVHILWFWIGVTMTTKTTLTRTISYWAAGSSASLDLLLLLALSQPLPPPSEVHLHSQAAKAGGWSGCGAWLLPSHAPEEYAYVPVAIAALAVSSPLPPSYVQAAVLSLNLLATVLAIALSPSSDHQLLPRPRALDPNYAITIFILIVVVYAIPPPPPAPPATQRLHSKGPTNSNPAWLQPALVGAVKAATIAVTVAVVRGVGTTATASTPGQPSFNFSWIRALSDPRYHGGGSDQVFTRLALGVVLRASALSSACMWASCGWRWLDAASGKIGGDTNGWQRRWGLIEIRFALAMICTATASFAARRGGWGSGSSCGGSKTHSLGVLLCPAIPAAAAALMALLWRREK